MSFIGDLFAGGAKGIVEAVGSVADRFIQTKDEKAKFELEVEEVITTRLGQIEESARARMNMTAEIIKAEMASGDAYTKRARPTVVYFGLLLIGWNYGVGPMLSHPPVELPSEFWLAWGSVISIWSIGRTAERIGIEGKVTKVITGNNF